MLITIKITKSMAKLMRL